MTIEQYIKELPKEGDKMKVSYLIGNQWQKSDTKLYRESNFLLTGILEEQ